MLKITKLLNLGPKVFGANNVEVIGSSNNRTNKMVINLSRNLIRVSKIETIEKPTFLTFNAKKVFNCL